MLDQWTGNADGRQIFSKAAKAQKYVQLSSTKAIAWAVIQKSIREGSVFELEHKVQGLDGSLGWTFSRAIPVRDEDGKVIEWFGAASDITAQSIRSVLSLYEGRLRQAGIEVIFDCQECAPMVALGDEIRQVLVNLVGNAVDAMRRGGILTIRVRPATDWKTGGESIRIAVADNGHGMSRLTQAQIYKPFFTTREETGTGLGLWISADIMLRHHGYIRLRSSDTKGRSGTAFSLLLPYDGIASS